MLNFLKRNGSDDVAKFDTVVRESDGPTPPFRMEFAPGVIVIDAEIRDRASLDVFVAALQAMGALLPNVLPPPVEIPMDAKPADAVRTIILDHPLDRTPTEPVVKAEVATAQ